MLADTYLMLGRAGDARALFERVLDLANDVGLLAEELDVDRGALTGGYPHAPTHASLARTARNLDEDESRLELPQTG